MDRNAKSKFGQTADYKLCSITPKHLSQSSFNLSNITKTTGGASSSKTPMRTPLVSTTGSSRKHNSNKKNSNTNARNNTNSKSKTPHTVGAGRSASMCALNTIGLTVNNDDRYIPSRGHSNMEASYHMMMNSKTSHGQENQQHHNMQSNSNSNATNTNNNNNNSISNSSFSSEIKRNLLKDSTNSGADKVLHLSRGGKLQHDLFDQAYADNIKGLYLTSNTSASTSMILSSQGASSGNTSITGNGNVGSSSGSVQDQIGRQISSQPDKILDAPDYRDDFYLNLIDWSTTNNLAVALDRDLYIWNATTKSISQLFSMDERSDSNGEDDDYITACSWITKGNILAVGSSKQNSVELWDVAKQTRVRTMRSHTARVASIAWNSHVLTTGSRSGDIHQHDVRVAKHHVGTFRTHTQEVCGLKWNSDGRHLASGANDNLVAIWDTNNTSMRTHSDETATATPNNAEITRPLHVLREHTAAVKALAWCPWQLNVLATGGGTLDRTIKTWNMYNGAQLHSQYCGSQVSALLFSRNYKELISSHGHQANQLCLWKWPEMSVQCEMTGHSNRILGMCMSPNEDLVVSVGADETLRFWKCFEMDEKTRRAKEGRNRHMMKDNQDLSLTGGGLSRSIR